MSEASDVSGLVIRLRAFAFELRALIDEAADTLSLLRAALGQSQPQPIVSAPEATYVLVHLPSYGWVRATRTGNDWWAHVEGEGEIVYPTFWLPEPPRPVQSTPPPPARPQE
jgi:hypothetical protein